MSGCCSHDPEGNPYGGIAWQLDLLNIDSPGLPWVTTETGYGNSRPSGFLCSAFGGGHLSSPFGAA